MPVGTNPPLEIFARLLLPWEDDYKNLYKSVTWTFWKDGRKGFANYAAQDYASFIHLVESRSRRPSADTYIALGTQRMADPTKRSTDGFPKALRQVGNVVSFNSIWLDLDVKKGAYASTEEAAQALDDFINSTGLPPTTMEVLSGSGGLHAYWCTKEPMQVASWIPLSAALRDAALGFKLKFDPQVTVNPTGILRAPGTFNYKTDPPGVVTMLTDTSFAQYAYEDLRSPLKAAAPAVASSTHVSLAGVTGGHGTGFAQNFIENTPEAPPIALDAVASVCPAINDILARGGDGDPEPLWNLALMLASFTDDPVANAHRLSDQDPRYKREDTERKLQEKINARAANPSLGWPQCKQFQPLHPACNGCALLHLGKSPLNHAPRAQPVLFAQPVQFPNQGDPLLPIGYWRDANRHVFTTVYDDKGNPAVTDLLDHPLIDGGFDVKTNHLALKVVVNGIDTWGSLNVGSNMMPTPCAQALANATGIHVPAAKHKPVRDFLVAWITKLQNMKKHIHPATYGWTEDGTGFTFGEITYLPGGEERSYRGNSLDKRFMPTGLLKPWHDAMQLIYGNPALEVLVASAFAAPLVELAGSSSLVMSAYSRESGVGKTTALMLAQAVWGHPRSGMSSLNDTNNSVMKKIQDLKSLPIYWDELRTADQLEKAIDLVFAITQGKAKARLNRDITQAEAGVFTTMFVVASNYGIADTVYAHTEGTEAGGLRVFEMVVPPFAKSLGNVESQQVLLPLAANHGLAGVLFAAHIVKHRDLIRKSLVAYADQLDAYYKFEAKERFWAMTMSTLAVGAMVANHAGITRFDLTAIRDYLDLTMREMRHDLTTQSSTMSDPNAAVTLLNDMIAKARGRHLVMTDRIHYGAGRQLPVKSVDTDIAKLDEVWIQTGADDGRVRVVKREFDEWMRKRRINPKQIVKLLEKNYIVSNSRSTIGTGVPFLDAAAVRRYCYDFTPLNAPGSSPGSS